MTIIGLDIGGANVKASDGKASLSRPFPLWKRPEGLAEELAELLSRFNAADGFAVTMTGELADCFQSKAEGVHQILDAVEQVATGRPVNVWQTVGEFVSPNVAREFPLLSAAANWHALATWIGRSAPEGDALLIDVGSTTTDITPLQGGLPMPQGRTDVERLVSGELVYSGVRRTPLSAIAHSVPFRNGYCAMAAEFFASTWDIYLWLGQIAEQPDVTDTANCRPATREAAHDRLARMLCCDRTEFTAEDANVVASFLADVQRQRIAACVDRIVKLMDGNCHMIAIAGEGEFLARTLISGNKRLADCPLISLAESIGRQHSQAACAYALARLGSELPCF